MTLSRDYFSKPLLMTPHFSARPWGGNALREILGKNTPTDRGPIGESWELSDHPDGRSKVDGVTFGELLRTHPREMIGRDRAPEKFPILIKYIDAEGDLSVQVHPDDAWCARAGHDDRGKSECWYVMACKPDAKMVYGFREKVTADQVRAAVSDGRLTDLMNLAPIREGDFITIPPGCVHAMLGGTMVCEIQQSSNTTFRLYDWDRNPPRELHVEKSLEVSEFDPAKSPKIGHAEDGVLLDNEFFRVRLISGKRGEEFELAEDSSDCGAIVNIVEGAGGIAGVSCRRGDTLFVPAAATKPARVLAGSGEVKLLVTVSKEI
ncbi:mannose-6-phosphate isomerase, class I [soil metagenome]